MLTKKSSAVSVLTAAAGLFVGYMLLSPDSTAAPGPSTAATEQADSARFVLNYPVDPNHTTRMVGQTVYCGVQTRSEPFQFDVAVGNPPKLQIPDDPTSEYLPTHDGAGWLDVNLQGDEFDRAFREYRVPFNDSFSFSLTLGGRPNQDQMVRLSSIPAGDPDGGGNAFYGVATVLAQSGATDPFMGDGRTDNYCVSISVPTDASTELPVLPGEYEEGQISTGMPVPNDWVVDGNGADGGVLAAPPH